MRLSDVAARFGGDIIGDGDVRIDGVASLRNAAVGQLAFYDDAKHGDLLRQSSAAAVLLRRADAELTELPRWVVDDNPRLYFSRLAEFLHAPSPPTPGIAADAVVAESAIVGEGCHIGAGVVIGDGVRLGEQCNLYPGVVVGANTVIGAETTLFPRVVLYPNTRIGSRCLLHAGAVIGADGFGYADNAESGRQKTPQLGGVRIGNNVEIGANSAIDRGTLDDTVIGDGVKIDNLVQIGHNVQIGAHTIICGTAGIAGSVVIGKYCVIGGAAGIVGHVHIGDGARVGSYSAVTQDVKDGTDVLSIWPAMPAARWRRLVAAFRRSDKR